MPGRLLPQRVPSTHHPQETQGRRLPDLLLRPLRQRRLRATLLRQGTRLPAPPRRVRGHPAPEVLGSLPPGLDLRRSPEAVSGQHHLRLHALDSDPVHPFRNLRVPVPDRGFRQRGGEAT